MTTVSLQQLVSHLMSLQSQLEAKGIDQSLWWLERQINHPNIALALHDKGLTDNFTAPLFCYYHLLKNDLLKGATGLNVVKEQGDPLNCLNLLTGLFQLSAGNNIAAAKMLIDESKKHPDKMYCWHKLLSLSLTSGYYYQGARWLHQASTAAKWSNHERRILLQHGSTLYAQLYDYQRSISCSREWLSLWLKNPRSSPPPANRFSVKSAWEALTSLVNTLEVNGLRPFLTAGTLLGWQREREIMNHDKDLDVAFMPGEESLVLALSIVTALPRYQQLNLTVHSPSYASILDRQTGVVIDLLEFWQQEDRFACGWRLPGRHRPHSRVLYFKPFELVQDQWKEHGFWRPDDPDLYLTQLYGDWRTPNPDFDSCAGNCNLFRVTPLVDATNRIHINQALVQGQYSKAYALTETLYRCEMTDLTLEKLRLWLKNKLI